MAAIVLDGYGIAKQLRAQIAQEIEQRTQCGYRVPKLAVIMVGNSYASEIYARNKKSACDHVGIITEDYSLPWNVSTTELLALIHRLNIDPGVDGLLVELPLPAHIDLVNIIEGIDPRKDVDGLHPYNLGRLAQGKPYLRPCTPAGIMWLLEYTKEELGVKKATVVGSSNVVGLPMTLELIQCGATVTTCTINTLDLEKEVSAADILITATGHPNLIQGTWIKPGSIVIDVGISKTINGEIAGDVEFELAKERASWITPVPGGVGPMTITCLLQNTLQANRDNQLDVLK